MNCSLPGDKLWHVDVLAVFPLGAQPPDYVAKPKRREWARWHAQIKGQVPAGRGKGGPVTSVPTFPPSPPDRISALRSRLQQRAPAGAGRGSGSARSHASPARRPARDKPKRRRESRQDGTRGGDQFGLAATGSTTEIPINAGSAGTSRGAARYVGSRRSDSQEGSSQVEESLSEEEIRRRSGRRRDSRSGSDSRGSSEASSSDSLVPPLQKKAAREPGSVLRMLLTNVSEALAEAAVLDDPNGESLMGGNKMSSYFQIVARPQLHGKIRDARELEDTSAVRRPPESGRLPELGDSLAGRFLAVESAALTNNWQDAQHLEVIPTRHAGLAGPAVLLQAQKHARQVDKAAGRTPWKRNPYSGGSGGGAQNGGAAQGDEKGGGAGKGKKGKGGRKGAGAWRAPFANTGRDAAKETPAGGGGADK